MLLATTSEDRIESVTGDVETLSVEHVPLGGSLPPGDGGTEDVLYRVVARRGSRHGCLCEPAAHRDTADDASCTESFKDGATSKFHRSSNTPLCSDTLPT